jgi:site-specific recombinase XerD
VAQDPSIPQGRCATVLTADSVKQWHSKKALEAPNTARLYLYQLNLYWNHSLEKTYSTIDDYVAQVRKEQDGDINQRRKWASDLEAFVNVYVSVKTGRPLVEAAKNVLVASVTSYLKHCLGDRLESYTFTLGSKMERMAERRQKENVSPVTIDEINALYKEAKNKRDRAILSTLLSGGCGVSEWIQFNEEWFRYVNDIRANKVPIKINVTRPKTMQSYTHFLWDDAVEDVKDLLEERERDLGRQLTASDPLFTNQSGHAIKANDVGKTIRRLAHRSGAEVKDKTKLSYRIRVHEIGKDFFRTQLTIARVDKDVAEYLSGHVVDANAYNKYHKLPEGQAIIAKEASKLRPLLNIRTGKGQPQSETEAELQAAERTVKLLFPSVWEKYQMVARQLTAEQALEWFRTETLQVQPNKVQLPQTKRWDNHEYSYVKAAVESDDYDQALADGYEDFQSNGSNLHVLRKKKD